MAEKNLLKFSQAEQGYTGRLAQGNNLQQELSCKAVARHRLSRMKLFRMKKVLLLTVFTALLA